VVEQKDATEAQLALDEINVGMYLAEGTFLFETLANVGTDNAQGEVYLTDIIAAASERGDVGTVEIPEGPEMWGINDRAELARVEGAIRLRNNEEIMRSGVSMTMPETITVEPDVEIGSDVVIGRGVRLSGKTVIGDGARIDEGAIITDSQIRAGAHIKPYSVITESHVGTESQVGPFAHLRPGTHLSAKCKVGNFVETKKARLGEGSKASHLSYLGDCELGEAVNIGAGTITCNYDGVNKFKTTMGNGVFIGSDTQLVAPVTLGDDVYVGAGTTVTEDAPSGSLVISRVPQRNIEGWVEKKKKEREKE
jgi:bifunctional UDP-N-acetylglucosamine pyrophosphorylase/glucosamine-1-phosphate N-acetyltransferase